ncbi:MAG: acylphosphatase [Candidatus Korarchaeota archaeon]|nr:acylphosphatase [Candidatus Korarchaeota archaeon]
MKRRIVVSGPRVHGVGYRALVFDLALRQGLDKLLVYNAESEGVQQVVILVEGEEDQVEGFLRSLEERRPAGAEVESMSVEEYVGGVPPIERTLLAFQAEQWALGIPILLEVAENTRLIPEIAENTRLILGKLDRLDDIARGIEELGSRMEERVSRLEEELHSLKEELRRSGVIS